MVCMYMVGRECDLLSESSVKALLVARSHHDLFSQKPAVRQGPLEEENEFYS